MHKAKSYHRCVARLFLSQGLRDYLEYTHRCSQPNINICKGSYELCLHGADSGPYPGRKYFNHFKADKVTADDTLETRHKEVNTYRT